jgi:hypothetical protein
MTTEVIEHRSKVSPTGLLEPVRRPGYAPVCRPDDSGLLPFANGPRLAGKSGVRQAGAGVRASAFLDSPAEQIG